MTSIGLAIASRQTGGQHVCIVLDDRSRSEFVEAMKEAGKSPEVTVGQPEEVMRNLVGTDFLVVDCHKKDFARILRLPKLGAVLICKNASEKTVTVFKWGSVLDPGTRIVRSAFLPVGKGVDMAHVGCSSKSLDSGKTERRWLKHVDRQSGEQHVIRR